MKEEGRGGVCQRISLGESTEIRRWRFVDVLAAPVPAVEPAARPDDDADVTPEVVDDLGRVVEDAIFGKAGAFFRVALSAPDARFLRWTKGQEGKG